MTDQFALVTGGSTGIGEALCQQLTAAGYQVINFSRGPCSVAGVISVEVDLADSAATREAAEAISAQHDITTVVHNAGAIREKPLEQVDSEDLHALTQLHLGAAIELTQACLPAMKAANYGRIVLMSTRAIVGLANRTTYSATKAGLVSLARTWALELAPHGITVNTIAPGPIADTRMFHEVIPEGSPQMAAVAERVPVGRLGLPADVARAAMFFLGVDAGFITGQTLFVCGGTSVGSITFQ